MTPLLKKYFAKWSPQVDRSLDQFLQNDKKFYAPVLESMRYSIFAGGKRLRPILVIAGSEICGRPGARALPAACALEMIHTYSLIHDDLPAMDDDDLRRGIPTNHKKFSEGLAILAGDALLTYAFELLSKNAKMARLNCTSFGQLIDAVTWGAGFKGMVGGQVLDLEMDGGKWKKLSIRHRAAALQQIHESKTSALIQTSLTVGAILAGGSIKEVQALSDYGLKIGLAFQIADDILDIVGNKKLLGKQGSDRENEKLTYPALFGIQASRKKAQNLVHQAQDRLKIFKRPTASLLKEMADYFIQRVY